MAAPGFCLYVVGRLRGIPRGRLVEAVQATGGHLVRTPGSRVDVVAVSHSSARVTLVEAPPPTLPVGIPSDAMRISELTLKRRLGLLQESAGHQNFSAADLGRASGLSPEVIACLALFDVLEPAEGQFGFRDLRAAREAARLLQLGFGLDEIVEASVVLRQSGRGLHDTSVTEAPWGELMQRVGGRTGRLNGQYVLPLEEENASAEELIAQAEICEEAGDLTGAERLYRIAHWIDRLDPVIPFNLGTILDRLGCAKEAMLFYQQAIGRDPDFPDAWVNVAALQEAAGETARSEESLRRALACVPDHPLALFNLGRLLTSSERFGEAVPVWERCLATSPSGEDRRTASRLRLLCRAAMSGPPVAS
jgi:tetratricopeptide (TPR) repeat protein